MNELAALVRFVHLTAAIVLTGGFGFFLFVARPAFAGATHRSELIENKYWRSQLRLFRCCVALLLVTAVFTVWLQDVNVSGAASTGFQSVLVLLTQTQFGRVWLGRLALLSIVAILLIRQTGTHTSTLFLGAGFMLSACLLAASAFAGHAAAADGVELALLLSADGMHLLAGSVWLGGLFPLASLLKECIGNRSAITLAATQEATRRFSNLALASVILLIGTGAYNAWKLVGGFAPLFGTAYGELLLIKLALLLPLIGIGAINRMRLMPSIIKTSNGAEETRVALRQLSRNIVIEIALGVMILLVVGHMSVTPPARHVQPEWPFSFRWDWTILEKAPKAFAEVQRGAIWFAIGIVASMGAFFRGRIRILTLLIASCAVGYGISIADQAVMIDAYPDTYKRPAVAYQAISIANGAALYQDSGCAACHGASGRGDGPVASDLEPPPPDLTARHANAHTAGDLFWWLSHGVKPTSAMPGFSQSLSNEERWDLINYLRALSSGERAKNLAPVIEDTPWLVAPDFAYETNDGEAKILKDHRGNKIVLLIILNLRDTEERLRELAKVSARLQAAGVEIIVAPNLIDRQFVDKQLPGLIVSEGIREIVDTYKLFARSFTNENPITATPHAEFLIDKQGYIRARWLPAESAGWRNFNLLMQQTDALRKEKSTAPAPDEHVH